jgi:hypothetical protein
MLDILTLTGSNPTSLIYSLLNPESLPTLDLNMDSGELPSSTSTPGGVDAQTPDSRIELESIETPLTDSSDELGTATPNTRTETTQFSAYDQPTHRLDHPIFHLTNAEDSPLSSTTDSSCPSSDYLGDTPLPHANSSPYSSLTRTPNSGSGSSANEADKNLATPSYNIPPKATGDLPSASASDSAKLTKIKK